MSIRPTGRTTAISRAPPHQTEPTLPRPPPIATKLQQRLTAPLRTPTELRTRVQLHLTAAREAHAADPLVDIDLAQALAASCLALLELWPSLQSDQRALVQAACLWYATTHDAEDDFASVTGFDDDAMVLNHVAEALGRTDLRVTV